MKNSKKPKHKLNKKGLLVLLLALYLGIMAFYYVWNLPVKTVIINGNELVSDDEIIKSAKINNKTRIITLSQGNIIKNIKTNNLIDDVTVKKNLDGTLVINVTEVKVLFYNYLNNSYVLSNGKELGEDYKVIGMPILINYVPNDIYDNLIKKMSRIKTDTIKLISEIEYDPDIKNEKTIDGNRFLLRMNDGNIVYINLANFDNLASYEQIYTQLDGKGVLNLDSISDKFIFTTFEALEGAKDNELSEQVNGNN